ncbi:hypothetical protein [Arthrobacter oryzae]|jgi:hypothetical protein|uniref:hypothetical protein n=1 Tax=Arthrobacter oryzae TaxID=409290 RepID=UPI0027815B5E|nr:hypothetical protein [Arthrobacter oryzae]MDQ0079373.1 hypothetical protein [Arthrobacter oryzae]
MDTNFSNSKSSTRASHGGDAAGHREFHVTYFDADCGLIRSEVFSTQAEAERFASRNVSDEQGWAVIDAVPAQQGRLAA